MRLYWTTLLLFAALFVPVPAGALETATQFRQRIRTPFQAAVDARDIPTVLSMLSQGIEINELSAQGGYTAVYFLYDEIALNTQHQMASLPVLQVLTEHGCDLNHQADNGDTPLHFAVGARDMEAVKWMLEHGARPDQRNAAGRAPWQESETVGTSRLLVAYMPNPTAADFDDALTAGGGVAVKDFYRKLQPVPNWLFAALWGVLYGALAIWVRGQSRRNPAATPAKRLEQIRAAAEDPGDDDPWAHTVSPSPAAHGGPTADSQLSVQGRSIDDGLSDLQRSELFRLRRWLLPPLVAYAALLLPVAVDPLVLRAGWAAAAVLLACGLALMAGAVVWWQERQVWIQGRGMIGAVLGLATAGVCGYWSFEGVRVASPGLVFGYGAQAVVSLVYVGICLRLRMLAPQRSGLRTSQRIGARRRHSGKDVVAAEDHGAWDQIAPGWDESQAKPAPSAAADVNPPEGEDRKPTSGA